MNAAASLAGAIACAVGIPTAVAVVASPINRARDARRDHDQAVNDERLTAELIAQIRHGERAARTIPNDTADLAYAAYRHVAAIQYHLRQTSTDGAIHTAAAIRALTGILNTFDVAVLPVPATVTPLADAVAAQLLLHRLSHSFGGPHPHRSTARVASGCLDAALPWFDHGRAIGFNPLTEFDPARLHDARAEWMRIAQAHGLLDYALGHTTLTRTA
jgi:hypothetical protein